MKPFAYDAAPARVVFGPGKRAEAAAELDRLGVTKAIVVATAPQAEMAAECAQSLGDRAADVYPGAAMHTPTDVTASAMQAVEAAGADGIVAIGGGSAVGLSKAIALRTDLPQLCLPTTYAGSEMTEILGQTENGLKTTLRDPKVRPETVIYDPELTVSLPDFITGPSGMNAIAHAVEALYAPDGNPIIALMAEESIRALGAALPRAMADGADMEARGEALYGAWLAGACLGAASMGLHHKICHTLGGTFDLPHADVHALMIAYSAAYNAKAAPDAMARVARALDAADGPGGLFDLFHKVGRKTSLAALGMSEAGLERCADIATQNPYANPEPITRDGIRTMLQAAFEGRRPS